MLALCKALYPQYGVAALTNDIFTQEVGTHPEEGADVLGPGVFGPT